MVAAVTISGVVDVVAANGCAVCGAALGPADAGGCFAGGGIWDCGGIAVCAGGFISLAFRFGSA